MRLGDLAVVEAWTAVQLPEIHLGAVHGQDRFMAFTSVHGRAFACEQAGLDVQSAPSFFAVDGGCSAASTYSQPP